MTPKGPNLGQPVPTIQRPNTARPTAGATSEEVKGSQPPPAEGQRTQGGGPFLNWGSAAGRRSQPNIASRAPKPVHTNPLFNHKRHDDPALCPNSPRFRVKR